jgi:ketosteroid isomerase-like protein
MNSMDEKLKKLIEKYITAYNNFDIDGMMNCFTDDCTFTAIAGGRQIKLCKNAKEFRQTAEQTAGYFKQRQQIPSNFIIDGTKAAVEIHYSATIKIDLPNGLKAGQELALIGISVFMFKKDKILKLTDYS